jgi:hypothetical protein
MATVSPRGATSNCRASEPRPHQPMTACMIQVHPERPSTCLGPATWATPKVPSRSCGDAVREGNNMSDQRLFVINRIGPDSAHDVIGPIEPPTLALKPRPRSTPQRSRLREVEHLLATVLALSPAELIACMVFDRYRFRISVYQHLAGAALTKIFENDFDRRLYLWAHAQLDDDGVPSPVHGALLEILARRFLTSRDRSLLGGAWLDWHDSRKRTAEAPIMPR